jgi:hypothetical protein
VKESGWPRLWEASNSVPGEVGVSIYVCAFKSAIFGCFFGIVAQVGWVDGWMGAG